MSVAAAGQVSDLELVERAQSGDYDAFEALVERYQDRLFRLVIQMVGTKADAEEVLQDAFLSMYRGLDGFKGQSSFSTWAYRVAKNAALMRLRTRRRKPLSSIEDLGGDDVRVEPEVQLWPSGVWASLPEDQALRAELREEMQRQFDELDEKSSAVIMLRDVEGMSNEEAAEALEITVSSVKSRLHRARLALRQGLAKYLEREESNNG